MQMNGSATHSQSAGLTLSGTGTNVVPALISPAPAQPVRWGGWAAAVLAGFAALAVGAFVNARMNPSADPTPIPLPNSAPPTAGLPDVRSPEKLVTTRERELLALLDKRGAGSQDVINHSIELGLTYVREHRFEDADARFAKLEKEQFAKEPFLTRTAGITGRLGQAIVMAYREMPTAAQQSNDLFLKALVDPFPKIPAKGDKYDRGYQVVAPILLRHPDLGQAVAETLNRNSLALGKSKLEPNALELLRTPPKAGKQ